MNDLIENIDKLHITEMGTERIKRNCQIETGDVVQWSKMQILDETAIIERIGKNWYVVVSNYKITVNAHSYTIITAHITSDDVRRSALEKGLFQMRIPANGETIEV